MKILETKIMRGPNQWSSDEKFLIVQKILLDDIPEEKLADFNERIVSKFPLINEKNDTESSAGNSVIRLIRYLSTELQMKAEMACTYSRAKASRNKNEFYLIFSYIIEQAGIYAGEAAVRI